MRRAVPVLVFAVLVALGVLGWKQNWFVGAESGKDAPDGVPVAPTDLGTKDELKGKPTFGASDADPKEYEGDPVGRLKLGLGAASVTGRVLSADGQPLRFARVTVALPPPDGGHSVRTTKEGTFEIAGLAATEYDLHASAEGYVSRSVRTPALAVGQQTALADIALKAKSPSKDGLRIKVVEEASGRPVQGAKITASTLNYGLIITLGAERTGVTDTVTRQGVTDELGICELDQMAPDKYDVVVAAKGFVLEPVENVVVAAGRVEHVAVSLKPGLSIQGLVIDADGLPVGGAFVSGLGFPSFRSYESVTTSATGSFTLDGLSPGNYMMFAYSDAKGSGQATGVKAGERAARIQLKGIATLTGKVIVQGGGAVTDFTLRPYTADPFIYVYSRLTHVKDENGRFTLPLPPGSYMLDVKAEGASTTTTKSIAVAANQTVDVTIELPPEGVVKGVITDPDGNHLAGAEVFVKSGGFPPVPIREKYARADADGQFVLKGLALKPVKLHVRHASFATRIIETTPVEPAKAIDMTIRLSPGARVEGHVRSKDGTPVAGERLNLFQGFDFFSAKTTFTDDTGAFTFRAIAEGAYQCSTGRFENNASGQQQSVTVPAEGTVTVDFQIDGDKEGGGSVTGVVTVAGKPAVKATVLATDGRGEASGISVETDVDGRYTAKGLNAGEIRVQVSTQDGNFRTRRGTIEKAGGSVVLDVAFGASRLQGVLVGSDGKVTVSGAWVQAEVSDPKADEGGWSRVRGFVTSGNDGQFAFQGLDPGTYRLRIQANMGGYASKVTEPFALADGESKDLGRIQLAAGAGITGRVTDEAGSPLEGVGVSLENSRGEPVFYFSMSSTGSDGAYSVAGLEYGVYHVIFEKKGFAPARREATVSASGGGSADAVLRRGGALAVSVEDENGKPVEGARIELYENGKRVEKTLSIVNLFDADVSRTGAEGTTTIADLAPSTFVVKAVLANTSPLSDWPTVTVGSGGVTPVKIVLRKGS